MYNYPDRDEHAKLHKNTQEVKNYKNDSRMKDSLTNHHPAKSKTGRLAY